MLRRAVSTKGEKQIQFDFPGRPVQDKIAAYFGMRHFSPPLAALAPLSAQKSTLRLQLALLVAGTMLPIIVFATGVVDLKRMRARDAAFERVVRGRSRDPARTRHRDAGRHAGARSPGKQRRCKATTSRASAPTPGLPQELIPASRFARDPRWPADFEHPRARRRTVAAAHQSTSIEAVFSSGKPDYSDLSSAQWRAAHRHDWRAGRTLRAGLPAGPSLSTLAGTS